MSTNSKDISKLRQNYSKNILENSIISENPFDLFDLWFSDALKSVQLEPNAMVLSTVANNAPKSRIVLLKGIEDESFIFYTNYESAKGKEIAANPNVSLLFFWDMMEQQVRIEGEIVKMKDLESDSYFHSRPRGSQIGAWVSNQSEVIDSSEILNDKVTYYTNKFEGMEIIPRPAHWGGYKVIPNLIEFWQGRPSRLHDRVRYSKNDNSWKIERLSP